MVKALLLLAFSLAFLASCGGYFDHEREGNSGEMQPLAIAGGGFLSSDTADDITPFFYRDAKTEKSYLFFSSDRTGNYDIYYAEMLIDGTFNSPVKLGTNVNTTNNEYAPVVYTANSIAATPLGTNSYLSILQTAGPNTNIVTFYISNDFKIYSTGYSPTTGNYKSLSVFVKTNIAPKLILSTGNTNQNQCNWDSAISTGPCWQSPNIKISNFTKSVYASSGYMVNTSNAASYYLLDVLSLTKRQLYFGFTIAGILTNFIPISAYSSSFNDRDGDIDINTKKVYFSSDRAGTFDLYRYNTKTFDKYIP